MNEALFARHVQAMHVQAICEYFSFFLEFSALISQRLAFRELGRLNLRYTSNMQTTQKRREHGTHTSSLRAACSVGLLTYADATRKELALVLYVRVACPFLARYVCIRQHTSAYVSIRQHWKRGLLS